MVKKSKYKASEQTTFSVKVSESFADQYRAFCDRHCLQTGKFTEAVLTEVMEDVHFGKQAQAVLSRGAGELLDHDAFMKRTRPKT